MNEQKRLQHLFGQCIISNEHEVSFSHPLSFGLFVWLNEWMNNLKQILLRLVSSHWKICGLLALWFCLHFHFNHQGTYTQNLRDENQDNILGMLDPDWTHEKQIKTLGVMKQSEIKMSMFNAKYPWAARTKRLTEVFLWLTRAKWFFHQKTLLFAPINLMKSISIWHMFSLLTKKKRFSMLSSIVVILGDIKSNLSNFFFLLLHSIDLA